MHIHCIIPKNEVNLECKMLWSKHKNTFIILALFIFLCSDVLIPLNIFPQSKKYVSCRDWNLENNELKKYWVLGFLQGSYFKASEPINDIKKILKDAVSPQFLDKWGSTLDTKMPTQSLVDEVDKLCTMDVNQEKPMERLIRWAIVQKQKSEYPDLVKFYRNGDEIIDDTNKRHLTKKAADKILNDFLSQNALDIDLVFSVAYYPLTQLDGMIKTCEDWLDIANSEASGESGQNEEKKSSTANEKKEQWLSAYWDGTFYAQGTLKSLRLYQEGQDAEKKAKKLGWKGWENLDAENLKEWDKQMQIRDKAYKQTYKYNIAATGVINLLDQHCSFDSNKQKPIERMEQWARSESLRLCKEYRKNPLLSSNKIFCVE